MPDRTASPSKPSGRLILLCGVSFAGKSTAAQAIRADVGAVVVSLDAINERRGLRGGDGIPVEQWQRTHRLAAQEVRGSLSRGDTVVVDDTSSLRFLRDRWRTVASGAGAPFTLVFVQLDRAEVLARCARNRDSGARHDVVDAVLAEHLDRFEPPEQDEDAVAVRADDDLGRWVRHFLWPRLRASRPAGEPTRS